VSLVTDYSFFVLFALTILAAAIPAIAQSESNQAKASPALQSPAAKQDLDFPVGTRGLDLLSFNGQSLLARFRAESCSRANLFFARRLIFSCPVFHRRSQWQINRRTQSNWLIDGGTSTPLLRRRSVGRNQKLLHQMQSNQSENRETVRDLDCGRLRDDPTMNHLGLCSGNPCPSLSSPQYLKTAAGMVR